MLKLYRRLLRAALTGLPVDQRIHVLGVYRQFFKNVLERLSVNQQVVLLQEQIEADVTAASIGVDGEIALLRGALAGRLEPNERFHIPALERRQSEPLNTWTYQNERLEFDIKPGERVLDVGFGGWPFRQATHLADLYVGETTHRMESLKRDDRLFLVIDVQKMPFRDKEWDFIFCSHVLEHLERPGDACRELMRVSRRGYIEVPTRLSDVMLNFTKLQDHHRWHGLVLGQTLVLIEWADSERRDIGTNYCFQCLHSRYHNWFQRVFEDNWSTFYGMLQWRDQFSFLIIDKEGVIVDSSDDRTRT